MADPAVRKRRAHLKRHYGITLDEYRAMHEAQGGLCLVCKRPEIARDPRSRTRISLAVDHDHETGKIRGLLCSKCNRAIGYLQDDPHIILAAAAYILRHRAKER